MERVEIMLGDRRVMCDKDMVKKVMKKQVYVAEIKRLQAMRIDATFNSELATFEPVWLDRQISEVAQKLINLNRTIRPCIISIVS